MLVKQIKLIFLGIFWGGVTSSALAVEPLPIGNFALPISQRPGAFYSFGSKILERGQIQADVSPSFSRETGLRIIGLPGSIQFGTTDNTSFLLEFPVVVNFNQAFAYGGEIMNVSGTGNITFQGLYEFYKRSSLTDAEEIGAIFGVTPPTGPGRSARRAMSYFMGATYTHTWVHKLLFFAPGYLLTEGPAERRGFNSLFYETGVGIDLGSKTGEYNYTGFIEFNGQYNQKDPASFPIIVPTRTVRFSRSPASLTDGFFIGFTPSVRYAGKEWIFQLNFSTPMVQYWSNSDQKAEYLVLLDIAYTIV